jgi:very-short-patch-repair endonuclease
MYNNNEPESLDDIFPMGLPIGQSKPNLTVNFVGGRQITSWKTAKGLAVLKGNVYPNFSLYEYGDWIHNQITLQELGEINFEEEEEYNLIIGNYAAPSWIIALRLCQSQPECDFFKAYIEKYAIPYQKTRTNGDYFISASDFKGNVPALVPQVWIKWDNQSAKSLNRMGYDADSPYRVDFVIFWNNKMYIILLDGIQHYANKVNGRWDADEQTYAARLKEDRLLRLQGWEVFRVGNWEIRDKTRLSAVLEELRMFVGFPEPILPPPMVVRPKSPTRPPRELPQATEDDEDLPF